MRWIVACSMGVVLAACGPGSIGDEGTGGGSTSTGTTGSGPPATSDTTGFPFTDVDVDTGATASATDGLDSTGTDTGPQTCVPSQEEIVASFQLVPDVEISATCTVLVIDVEMGTSVIDLDCAGTPVTLTTVDTPWGLVPDVPEGGSVRLRYIVEPIFWENRWLAIHSADGRSDRLLFGGVSGSSLDPPGMTLDELFAAGTGEPLISEVTGLCEPFYDECNDVERVALAMSIFGAMATGQAPDHGQVALDVLAYGYALVVQSAVHNLPPYDCTDTPSAWYELLVYYFPSD